MSIPIEELTENDYLILEYINRFPSVHKTDIEQHFKGKIASLDYRLSVLAKVNYKMSGGTPFPISNSNYISEEFYETDNDYSNPPQSKEMFHITDFGKVALQDHLVKKKSDKKQLFVKNAWMPIIVTLITNLLIDGVKWLFPLIQQWLANIQK